MPDYRVVHSTEYRFERPAADCRLLARAQLRDTATQSCLSTRILTEPPATLGAPGKDPYGNRTTALRFGKPLQRLKVWAINSVRVERRPRPMPAVPWESACAATAGAGFGEYLPSTNRIQAEPAIVDYARTVFGPGRGLDAAVAALNRAIHEDFRYDPRATDTESTAIEVFALGGGVCQDLAHLAIACCRGLGLAARYVSGYLDTKSLRRSPPMVGRDHSHAWFSVLVPGAGWFDYDPTLGCAVGEHHIVAAWGRDCDDVAPVAGSLDGGGRQQMAVAVDVSRS